MNTKRVLHVVPLLLSASILKDGTRPLWGNPAGAGSDDPVAVERSSGPAADCGQNAIAQAMRDVFPPAPVEVRAHSADTLRFCRPVGAEGVLAAAINQKQGARNDEGVDDHLAIARALATFHSPVALSGLRALALAADRPPALRAVALPALAADPAGSDALVGLLGNVNDNEGLRLNALDLLIAGGRTPDATYLTWLKRQGSPRLRQRAQEILASAPASPSRSPSKQLAPISPSPDADEDSVAPTAVPRVASPAPLAAAAPPPPRRTGPRDGTALAIGASTVAGGALMLNLSLLGFQDTTPQLLLGSAGAVIGFGTSWALSRFGVRPTLEQAAWFTNTTAWGTLAGLTMYEGSGADNYKLRYFSLVAGEVTGMAAGVWSARRWKWTGEQIVMSDSLFLGAALAG
ncbi:MAG: hypothetical protein ABIW57_10290, partial [Polyangia bacterium]